MIYEKLAIRLTSVGLTHAHPKLGLPTHSMHHMIIFVYMSCSSTEVLSAYVAALGSCFDAYNYVAILMSQLRETLLCVLHAFKNLHMTKHYLIIL